MKPILVRRVWCSAIALLAASLMVQGCVNSQPDLSATAQGPAPLRTPSPARQGGSCSFEDSLTGGQIFSMYCAECHNPRPLSERPFANYQNVAAHMRVRANLTGKEWAKLMEFLYRWHDMPPPTPPVPPTPTRFNFSQPIAELRGQTVPPQPPGNPGLHPPDVRGIPEVPAGLQPAIVPVGGSSAADSTPPSP